ncbi:pentalenene oxygenase-like [Sycon ciliatum]|uniref:pentalenene oxygenase-like n=1 Tax=Sycon ciliatum TaxID=27933 RepID=UPI0031F6676B
MLDVAQVLLYCGVPLLFAVWYLKRQRQSASQTGTGKLPKLLELGYSNWTGHIGYVVGKINAGPGLYMFNLLELIQKAPEPVVALSLFGPLWVANPVYAVNDPVLINVVTSSSKTTRFASFESSSQSVMGKKSMSALRGEELKRHRKLLASSILSRKALGRLVELMGNVTDAFLQTLPQPKAGESSFALDLVDGDPIGLMLLDVFSLFGFGTQSTTTPEGLAQREKVKIAMNFIFDVFADRMSAAGLAKYISYLNISKSRQLANHNKFIRQEIIIPAIRRRQSDINEGVEVPNDALTVMLEAGDDDSPAFTEEEICDEALLIMVASYETTANTILWLFYHLAMHPECQQRCYEEVCQVMSSHPPGTQPSITDIDQMTYLNATLQESNRLRPIAQAITRETVEDLAVGDYVIPKGNTVMCYFQGSALSEEVFTDAKKFIPQRWLNDPNGGAKKPGTHSLPFGNGPFRCFGKAMAVQAIHTLFSQWIQRYRFEMITEDVKPRIRLAYYPSELTIRMFPRQQEGQ